MPPLRPSASSTQPTPSPPPAPVDLENLGERIAELSAQIQAATYHLLVMIREFDERNGWNTGFRSCAHWLNWRTGLDLGAAREKVRVARALADLPLLSASMGRGEISYSKVRALPALGAVLEQFSSRHRRDDGRAPARGSLVLPRAGDGRD